LLDGVAVGEGLCFSISRSVEFFDEVSEIRMASLVGIGDFSTSGSEEMEEREVIRLEDSEEERVEWMHRFTSGEARSSCSSFVNHVKLSV
jgi:hypothetical protein